MHPRTPLSSRRPKDKDVKPPPSETQETELLQTFNILTLAYHRNKNQHRRSRWWKELGLLRRNLRRLLAESERKKEKEREERAWFLRERLLPRCWVAFSGLVGDNQYAALGLMLLGTLARLGRVLGLDVRTGVAGGELDVVGEGAREEPVAKLAQDGVRVDEDLGVPLAREEVAETEEALSKEDEKEYVRSEGKAAVVETERLPAKKKRKKKKYHDAIDELFSGLV